MTKRFFDMLGIFKKNKNPRASENEKRKNNIITFGGISYSRTDYNTAKWCCYIGIPLFFWFSFCYEDLLIRVTFIALAVISATLAFLYKKLEYVKNPNSKLGVLKKFLVSFAILSNEHHQITIKAGDARRNKKVDASSALGLIALFAWFLVLLPGFKFVPVVINFPIVIFGFIFSIKGLKSQKRHEAIASIGVNLIASLPYSVLIVGFFQGLFGG